MSPTLQNYIAKAGRGHSYLLYGKVYGSVDFKDRLISLKGNWVVVQKKIKQNLTSNTEKWISGNHRQVWLCREGKR